MDVESCPTASASSPAPKPLHTLVFHSLHEQIAVIDQVGTIVDVNAAWISFGTENGLSSNYVWQGNNYLEALTASQARGDALAGDAASGIREVLDDRRTSFHLEYPCHSPDEKRWFAMRVTRLMHHATPMFAISHYNVTQRKLAENRAEYLSLHDPLTGMANRRYFNLTLDRFFQSALRDQRPVSLISVDIDHFKDFNDQQGHLAGDDCLALVGQAMLSLARRPNDLAARVGGDEFAVLLGDTDLAESHRLAEAILTSIHDLRIVYGESKQVTASAGVASMVPRQPGKSNEPLLRAADDALYRAKQTGRNRVLNG